MTIFNYTNYFCDLVNFFYSNEEIRETKYPVVLYKNNQPDLDKFIFYNTEQTYEGFDFRPMLDERIVELWDYSEGNLEFFNKKGVKNLKYVPPQIWDEFKTELLSYNENNHFEYDVAFVGTISPRRERILNELEKKNIKLAVISHDFTETKNKLISKSKILLNIHYMEHWKIFERIRCFPWMGVKKQIVSENSIDNDNYCHNVNYDQLVNTVENVLESF